MADPATITVGKAALLGSIQGLTEFLPVSSSGHLALAGHVLGTRQSDITLEILVHIATLLAVVVYYWRDVVGLAKFWLITVWRSPERFRDPLMRLSLALIVGTAVTVAVVFPLKDPLESVFDMPRVVGLMLLLTAVLLALTLLRRSESQGNPDIGLLAAGLIGLVQGLAATPGISRSGSTIAVALLLGIARPEAARFSFLLSIPAILGAALLKLRDFEEITLGAAPMAVAFVTSAVVGFLALWVLVGFVRRGRLAWFAPYCVAVGLAAILFA
jgi:undecaprenyl-diphosphatase